MQLRFSHSNAIRTQFGPTRNEPVSERQEARSRRSGGSRRACSGGTNYEKFVEEIPESRSGGGGSGRTGGWYLCGVPWAPEKETDAEEDGVNESGAGEAGEATGEAQNNVEEVAEVEDAALEEVVEATVGPVTARDDSPDAPGELPVDDDEEEEEEEEEEEDAVEEEDAIEEEEVIAPVEVHALVPCGICTEDCRLTVDPFAASMSDVSNSTVPFAMFIGRHMFCIGCLQTYISGKLDDVNGPAFPVLCPEFECREVIEDRDAERIFGADGLESWHYRKVLDSMPLLFCPSKTCSIRVLPNENADHPQAQCPSCDELICGSCNTLWHHGRTCGEYQALPLAERSPEDAPLLELAGREGWKPCHFCSVITDRWEGCYHITCTSCKSEWCWLCGGAWDLDEGRCAADPPCALFHDPEADAARNAAERRAEIEAAAAEVEAERQRVREERRRDDAERRQEDAEEEALLRARLALLEAHNRREDRLNRERNAALNVLRVEREERRSQEIRELERQRNAIEREERIANRAVFLQFIQPPRGKLNHAFTSTFLNAQQCGYCLAGPFHSVLAVRHHLEEADHGFYACCKRLYRGPEEMAQHCASRKRQAHGRISAASGGEGTGDYL